MTPDEWDLWNAWARAQRLLTRELDRGLQRACGISKAEYSVLITLWRAPGHEMRVAELVETLGWEKSRIAHQLTRMENRDLVSPLRAGPGGRRVGIALTGHGRTVVEAASEVHGGNVRRLFFDSLTGEQAAVIRSWCEQTIDRIEPDR